MPSEAASCCCSGSRNRSSGVKMEVSGLILGLLQVVRVWPADDGGRFLEVLLRRRRGRLPLQSGRTPRVRRGSWPPSKRVEQVKQRQDVAHAKDRGAGG